MAEDHVLRIVVDPTAARSGSREVESALSNVSKQAGEATRATEGLAASSRKLSDEQRRAAAEARAAMQARRDAAREAAAAERRAVLAAHDAREAAKASMQAIEQQYQQDMARIKEGMARGFLTPKEAAVAGREAAQAYNNAIVDVLDKGERAGAFRGRAGREAFAEVAGSLKHVDTNARSATVGLGRMNYTLGSLAARAAGTNAVTGQLATVVGSFAVGTAMTAGVLAGLAAIGFAYQRITKSAKESKKAVEEATRAIREQAREEATRGQATKIDQLTALRREEDRLRERIAEAEARVGRALAGSGLTDIQQRGAQMRVDALRKEYDELRKTIQQGEQQLADMRTESFKSQLTALNEQTIALREGARAAYAYRLQMDQSLSDDQRTQLLAIYDLNAGLEQQKQAIDKAKSAFEGLRDSLVAERNEMLVAAELRNKGADAAFSLSLALNNDLTPAMRAQLEAQRELNKETERTILLTQRMFPRLAAGTGRDGMREAPREVHPLSDNRPAWMRYASGPLVTPGLRRAAEEGQAALEAEQVWARAMENIQDIFADGFGDIFRDGLDGFKSMADAVGKIFGGLGRQIAAALAIEKLGIDDIIKTIREEGVGGLSTRQRLGGAALAGFGIGYSSGSIGGGVLGGLLSGAATGNPFAALGGAVAGLAGGLLGAAQKTREAQRIFTESLNNVRRSLEDIRDSAAGITDPMKGLRDQINQEFDAIRKAFRDRYGKSLPDIDIRTPADIQEEIDRLRLPASYSRVAREYREELENLNRFFMESAKLLEGSYRESLQDRLDQLTGNDAAVLLRRQQKEREEAIRAGFDATTLALLDQVHEQERLAQATKATSDAIRDVTSALNSPSGLRLSLHRWRATEFDPRDPEMFPQTPPSEVRPRYPVATLPLPELPPFNPSRDTNVPPMTQHYGDVIIQITQQLGESQTALADRIVESLERKQRRGGPAVVNRISSR